MNKNLYIHTSKIASILGYNKYVTSESYVNLFIDYLYKDRFDLLKHDEDIKKTKIYNTEEKFNNMVNDLLNKVSIEDKKIINTILKTSSKTTSDITKKNSAINKILNNIDDNKLSKTEKNKIKNELGSKINTKYGSYNENIGIIKYEAITGNKVYNSNIQLYTIKQTFQSNKIYQNNSEVNYIICGKVDGFVDTLINSSNNLIKTCNIFEIKNRKNKIFNEIPIYEKIQLIIYSYMLNIQNIIFVQNFNDQLKVDNLIIDIKNTDYDLFQEIISKLNKYIELIYILRNNEELRLEFISNKKSKSLVNFITKFINN